MIPRKRYGSKNTDQGVYLGLSKTQVLSPATAISSSSDSTPLPTPVALVPSPPDTMSCRDRTQEFQSACKSLQSRQAHWERSQQYICQAGEANNLGKAQVPL
uniref:Syntaxin 5A n=1 Tax=Mus musculus TaxID=10090 RepID=H3BL25_MOUSE